MAYRHECFCKYCKRYKGTAPGAKRMSVKLDRMDGKRLLSEEISSINYCGDYDDDEYVASIGDLMEENIELWLREIESLSSEETLLTDS